MRWPTPWTARPARLSRSMGVDGRQRRGLLNGVVVTMARTLGREDGLHVRQADGTVLDAELAGWDPATSLAVLRVPGLTAAPLPPSAAAGAGRPPGGGHCTFVE